MSRIFISYASADVEFARKLARSLSEMGADIWIDVNDIPAGMKWSTAIQQGLNVCEVMLVIISPDSMASNNVEDEWQYYLDKKKHVIPIWYRPADKHFQISRLQHVDFHSISYHNAFDHLMHELNVKGISFQTPTNPVGAQGFAPSVPNPTPSPRIEFAPTPKPTPSEPTLGTHIIDDKGVEMVYVPAGKFLMGNTEQQVDEIFAGRKKIDKDAKRERYEDQLPQHEVIIPQGFWIDLIPVTNAAYAWFVNSGGYATSNYWTETGWAWAQQYKVTDPEDYDNFTDPQQPRVGVSWYESFAYACWRGGRLPTEAEWEWAACGPKKRIYPWGNTFDASCIIYRENSSGKTAVVGSDVRLSGASWVGALDMSGNVWEWGSSLYKPYPYRLDDGREDQDDGTRVLRGGSWPFHEYSARCAYRAFNNPDSRFNNYGFRIVRQ